MAYKSKEALVGKKFVAKRTFRSIKEGEIAEVPRIDIDNDIVVTGESDYHYVRDLSEFNSYFELYLPEFDSKWIVWNHAGSLQASSEEEAKSKAEELLNKGVDGPVYIAKAMNKAEINRVVWAN